MGIVNAAFVGIFNVGHKRLDQHAITALHKWAMLRSPNSEDRSCAPAQTSSETHTVRSRFEVAERVLPPGVGGGRYS